MKVRIGIAGLVAVVFAVGAIAATGGLPRHWTALYDNFEGYCFVGMDCERKVSLEFCEGYADVFYTERDGARGLTSRDEIDRIRYRQQPKGDVPAR